MKKIVIEENSFLTLEDKYLPFVKEIIQLNQNTPIRLSGNTVFFNEYTVGIIKLDDLIIEIRSRNESITMNTIFEMYWFVNNGQSELRLETMGFDLNNSFELTSVTDFFYKLCTKLLQIGITGSFNKHKDFSKIIRGNIIFEEYFKKEIPIRGLSTIREEYSINCLPNQVIKAAIYKLIQSEIKEENIIKLNSLLREFAYVDDLHYAQSELDNIELLIKTFYSPNPYYPIVLETSLKILRDLKISYNNGHLEWYMFLVNSNDLFEKYVRKMLQIGMKEDVIKWKEPKKYASIISNQGVGYKAFSPDIIIDYNETYDQGRVVLDVKNKKFNPANQNISELVSPSDLYQILFYCRQLKTNTGGIIYPTNNDFEPIKIEICDENNPLLYLFSINMRDTFENRLVKLKSEIKNKLLLYT